MSNVIKFPTPFEHLKVSNSLPEVNLRRAIITQAIIDATNISECSEAKKFELEAKAWIFGDDEDFKEICMEADIEPARVIKITKDFIKLHREQAKTKTTIRPQPQQTTVVMKKKLAA